jgi:predicted nucleic acid-binding protein
VKKYVLDSYALIAFFEDESGAKKTATILKHIVERKAHGYLSVINWGEIYYSTMREEGIEEAEKIIGLIKKYPIQIIDADEELTYHAAKLKGQYRIAYADCFAAALSIQMNASIVTGDPEFKKLAEKVNILWIS